MSELFVVHASVWDLIVIAITGAFVVLYLAIWAAESARQHRARHRS
jgi:hypothetical protein